MSHLRKYFENNNANAINKWMHYFEVYERHFSKYVGKEVVILEVGVYQGGSLKMWKDYFGNKAKIYAIDIHAPCKQFEEENIEIFIGSQSDKNFLRNLKSKIPKIDILIDDGGHYMDQQITTFEELYSHIKEDGIYLCEDLHTSYWKDYGGGYKRQTSYIEYSKNFIDYLHSWYSQDKALEVNEITRSTHSIHYYDSIIVLEKRIIHPPESKTSGKIIINIDEFHVPDKGNTSDNKLTNVKTSFQGQSLLTRMINKIKQIIK